MDRIVFHKKQYIIVQKSYTDFIVINKSKKFNKGHTHVKGINYAKLLVFIMLDGKITHNKHIRLLENKHFKQSIKRLSESEQIENRILKGTL